MENFDRENIDQLLEIRQIRQYFHCQNFVPYGIAYVVCSRLAMYYVCDKNLGSSFKYVP